VMEQVFQNEPARAERFAAKLASYERGLNRLQLADDQMQSLPECNGFLAKTFAETLLAICGAPLGLYGWIHRLLPYSVVRWAVRGFPNPGNPKGQASTATTAAGIVAFTFFFAVYIVVFHRLFGWPASFWYALSLPLASLLAHYYLREVRKLFVRIRERM